MFYFIRRRGLKPRSEWTVSLDEHLVWMKRQHDTGKIVMSGPTPDRQYGQYLIRAETRDEAEAIAAHYHAARKRGAGHTTTRRRLPSFGRPRTLRPGGQPSNTAPPAPPQ